jgi:hypothetical protein
VRTLAHHTTEYVTGREAHAYPTVTGTPLAVCGGCTATWRSKRLAHCGGCHRSFGSVSLFDRHRLGYGDHGRCEDPAFLMRHRMALVDGVWREPARSGAA